MLGVLKRKIRGWLFPEYERNRRRLERYGAAVQRLDDLDVDALVAAEAVVSEFAATVESANADAEPVEGSDGRTTLDDGRVVLLLGNYRDCQFEAGDVGAVEVYGENHVISNNLFESRPPQANSGDSDA